MTAKEIEFNQEIEDRIEMEIIVDTYNEEEQAMGWYCYLNDNMTFPFKAKWVKRASSSSTPAEELVEVIEMDESDDCLSDMFVIIRRDNDEELSVRLKTLNAVDVNAKTKQALGDWHYWIA